MDPSAPTDLPATDTVPIPEPPAPDVPEVPPVPTPPGVPAIRTQRIQPGLAARMRASRDRAMADPAALANRLDEIFQENGRHGFPTAFGVFCTSATGLRQVAIEPEGDRQLWFLGDIHGDHLALEAALESIPPGDVIVLLGDFVDRGPDSQGLVVRFLRLLAENPERVIAIVGNHDVALHFDDKARRFWSDVEPAEYVDWLNHPKTPEEDRDLAKFFIEYCSVAPRALFTRGGLFVTHGGFPFREGWKEKLQTFDDLWKTEGFLEDYSWKRAAARVPRKIFNPFIRGGEFGYENYRDFVAVAQPIVAAAMGSPDWRITGMVRGHDHVENRHEIMELYPALTINTMCCRMEGEVLEHRQQTPCIARAVPGYDLPEVIRLAINPDDFAAEYPPAPPRAPGPA